jgi:hypothetical protein
LEKERSGVGGGKRGKSHEGIEARRARKKCEERKREPIISDLKSQKKRRRVVGDAHPTC